MDEEGQGKEDNLAEPVVENAANLSGNESDVDMESSEEYEDSGNESSGEDVEFAMERDARTENERNPEDEYVFSVLTTKDIVEHMVDSIREVNDNNSFFFKQNMFTVKFYFVFVVGQHCSSTASNNNANFVESFWMGSRKADGGLLRW